MSATRTFNAVLSSSHLSICCICSDCSFSVFDIFRQSLAKWSHSLYLKHQILSLLVLTLEHDLDLLLLSLFLPKLPNYCLSLDPLLPPKIIIPKVPSTLLYNILLLINCYIDSIAISAAILQLPVVISSDL